MGFKFQTFSVIAGTQACNARCDFCISQQTPENGVGLKYSGVDFRNLVRACKLAEKSGVTTALITGKGEPTLFPQDILQYLEVLKDYFPIIELQTNSLNFALGGSQHPGGLQWGCDRRDNHWGSKEYPASEKWKQYDSHLDDWVENGLTTIITSITHFENARNREIYCDQDGKFRFDYPDLARTQAYLKSKGLSRRLSCVGCKGYIDSSKTIQQLIDFAKANGIEQLTWRPVTKPEHSRRDDVYQNTVRLSLDAEAIFAVHSWVKMNGIKLLDLVHGAEVFDVQGQNICISNCLTHSPKTDEIRQLIYFPDAKLRFDWVYTGAIIL